MDGEDLKVGKTPLYSSNLGRRQSVKDVKIIFTYLAYSNNSLEKTRVEQLCP